MNQQVDILCRASFVRLAVTFASATWDAEEFESGASVSEDLMPSAVVATRAPFKRDVSAQVCVYRFSLFKKVGRLWFPFGGMAACLFDFAHHSLQILSASFCLPTSI
ncbi:Unannotated [Lentimonas sp. CC10]|nr:Unannotated [Lentimonas sp. CC10]